MKILFLFFFGFLTAVTAQDNLKFEEAVERFKDNLESFQNGEKKEMKTEAFVQAVWDKTFESSNEEDRQEAKRRLQNLDLANFSLSQKLKIHVVAKAHGISFGNEKTLGFEKWNREDFLTFLSLSENYSSSMIEIAKPMGSDFVEWESEFKRSFTQDQWSEDQIKDLLSYEPNWRWRTRSYKDGVRLYMFCRHNREHPCRIVMKDNSGKWVKDNQGNLWSQPKLAMSRFGLPSHQVNGETPQGVYTIDSVMPDANRQDVFGKYRRLILNFIKKTRNEKELLSFMPSSVQSLSWWRQSVVARDIGRSLLRIHGTGLINTDPASSWYPLFPTSGCIASRENDYDNESYHDQRHLLDQMMISMGLPVEYQNETRLTGLLYVVNIDSKEEAVKESDILPYL